MVRDTRDISVGREALVSLVAKLGGAVAGFGGAVLFARLLGPDQYVMYTAALAAAFLVVQVSGGVGNAVRKRVSEVEVSPGRYLGTGIGIHLVITALVAGAAVVFWRPLGGYFGSVDVLGGVVLVVAALGLFQVVNRAHAGLGHPGRSTGIDTLRTVLTVGTQAVLVLLVGWGAFGLLVGLAAATAVAALGSLYTVDVWPSVPDRTSLRRVYAFAQYSVPTSLLTNAYSEADKLILNAVAASAVVGQYAVASQLVMPAAMLGGSIGDALGVKTSGVSSAGESIRDDLVNATTYAGVVAIPILFGAAALRERLIVTVYGPAYVDAWPALVGLACFQVFNVYGRPFEAAFAGSDRPRLVFRINLLVLTVHLPLAVLLGIWAGLIGVVGATVAAEAVRLVVYQYLTVREIGGGPVVPRPVVSQAAAGVVMWLAVVTLRRVVGITGWPQLSLVVGCGAAVYFGVLWAISPHFRSTVVRVLGPYLPGGT
jgi:O-antigen/teichoic acid export membrane protein